MKPIAATALIFFVVALIFDDRVYNGRYMRGATSMVTEIALAVGIR